MSRLIDLKRIARLGSRHDPDGSDIPLPKILIVDDEPHVRRAIVAALSHHYRVVEAPDGLRALDLLRDENPDLVVLDYLLPGLHGYEVCRKIKADGTSPRKVLMLTAYSAAGGRERAYSVGADAFLRKPFSLSELISTVENLVLSPVEPRPAAE